MFKYLAIGAIAAYAVYKSIRANDQDDCLPSYESQSHHLHEPAQPQVPQRDKQRHWQAADSSQRKRTPLEVPPSRSEPHLHHSHEPAQPLQVPRHDNQQDQQTIESSQSLLEVYPLLRARAKREGKLVDQYDRASQEAHDHGRAHARAVLSEAAKRHTVRKEKLNAKASAIIFKENNRGKAAGEVDLHGLFVKEAIAYSEKAITEARQRGDSEIRLIVGRGIHSDGGVPQLKRAVQKHILKRGGPVEVHPTNPGVLIVQLGGRW